MYSRREFIERGGLGLFFMPALSHPTMTGGGADFEGLVVNAEEGEAIRMRDGTSIVTIKIAKSQGAESLSFLSESFMPGDELPVHRHMNEDELIFIHKGTGLFTLGEKKFTIGDGAVALVPRGVWHGLKNIGTGNIEMRFSYSPSGFEGFFREAGTPLGQPFVQKTMEERRAIARKWGMIYKK